MDERAVDEPFPHLELASSADVDDQVRTWLQQAFDAAR